MNPAADIIPSDSPFQVRTMNDGEMDAAIGVIHQSVRQISPQDYPANQVQAILKMYDAETLGMYTVIVVQQQSQLVGVAAFRVHHRKCWVNAVFTHPDWLRQGIGRSLVQEIEHRALKQGAVWVGVPSSLTAVNFYIALGYERLWKDKLAGNVACVHLHKQLRSLPAIEKVGEFVGWMLLGVGALVLVNGFITIVALYVEAVRK